MARRALTYAIVGGLSVVVATGGALTVAAALEPRTGDQRVLDGGAITGTYSGGAADDGSSATPTPGPTSSPTPEPTPERTEDPAVPPADTQPEQVPPAAPVEVDDDDDWDDDWDDDDDDDDDDD